MPITSVLGPNGYVVSVDGGGALLVTQELAGVRANLATQKPDQLPPQVKAVSATGQVIAGPCKVQTIRCLTAGTVALRDSVTQTAAGTDTTSPTIYAATLAAGDLVRNPCEAAFGLHATVTSGTYELEF